MAPPEQEEEERQRQCPPIPIPIVGNLEIETHHHHAATTTTTATTTGDREGKCIKNFKHVNDKNSTPNRVALILVGHRPRRPNQIALERFVNVLLGNLPFIVNLKIQTIQYTMQICPTKSKPLCYATMDNFAVDFFIPPSRRKQTILSYA